MATLISTLAPRGGVPGDTIVIDGTEFGPLEGTLTVGGIAVTQITGWSDIQVTFVIPSGVPRDGAYIVRLVREDLSDADEEQFWIPAVDPFTAGLDYQLPNTETGPTQNTDLPRRAEAAVFNRMLDQIRSTTGGGAASITVSSDVAGGPDEVSVSQVNHIRFVTQQTPGSDHFVISRPNGEVFIGGSAAPDTLNGKVLTGFPATFTGRLSDGNINYKGADPAGSSVAYINRTTAVTLDTPDIASSWGFASLGNLILDINGTDVANIDLAANFAEINRSLGQVIANYNTTGTGDTVVAGVVTFTGGTLELLFVGPTSGLDTDDYQRANARITLTATAMRQGYNVLTLRHAHGPVETATPVEWFLDLDPAGAPQDPDMASTALAEGTPVLKALSGINYYDAGSTFLLSTVGNDLFNNVYHDSEAPIETSGFPGVSSSSIPVTDPSVTGLSTPPAIAETMTVTGLVITAVSGQQANDAQITVTPRDPYGSYTPEVSLSGNYTLMTSPTSSTLTEEFFQDELYRLPLTTNFDALVPSLTGNWVSATSLLDGSRTGELQVYNHEDALNKNQLRQPGFDYTTAFNPSGNPDYSSLSAGLLFKYARVYQATVDKSNGIISVPGLAETDVNNALLSNVLIDVKVPTKTVWLSLNKPFSLSTFTTGADITGGTDGEGCRINSGVHSPSVDGQIQFTLGQFFTGASTNRLLYLRITYAHGSFPNRLHGGGAGLSVVDW
jgi:hypothetical protein